MGQNVGGFDRLIRLVLAAVLLYLGLTVYVGSALGTGLAIAGAIAAISGLLGICSLYSLLGINTRHADQRPQA
jgi:preprotein translocase subunit SecF